MPLQEINSSCGKNGENSGSFAKRGIFLANPESGDEVVITGMAGRFPASDHVYEYRDNLMNKKDMISSDNRRWDPVYPEIPHHTGKIGCIEKFDAGFFGIHYRQAHQMDPNSRQLLERTFEAIMDAGYQPEELRGTKTGVFIGTCFSESEKTWFYDKLESPSFGITGCTRSMQAQWISYFLGLEGPSNTVDTACSSSLHALEHAYRAIRMGRCENAIVGGGNLCMHPSISFQFARLGVLSVDGSCKSFDADANGYVRAEAAPIVFLQKSKNARRIYAQIVHAKINSDGFTEQGITFPSHQMQKQLMKEMYQECNVDPTTIDFVEAHATGTKVGDPEEIMAIEEVFCTNRTTPLLVGSVKGNIGHTEPSSGLASVIKMLIGMENDCLIPNIRFKSPREGVKALEEGRMVVLTELIPWPKNGSGLTAVNSFGFGGSNAHVLLKRWGKKKINGGLLEDDLPRLVCVSGRTEESIQYILNDVSKRSLDAEYIRLLHEAFKNNIAGHLFRGFLVMSKTGELNRSFRYFDGIKQPLCVIFGTPNENWLRFSKHLVTIPLFTTTIQTINNILSLKEINLMEIINKGFSKNIIETVVANVSIQIALVDVLKVLELSPDYQIGYGSGELAAAYADGLFTLEETVLGAYYFGLTLQNIPNNCELGKYEPRLSSNHLEGIRPELLRHLKGIIPTPKRCSSKLLTNFANQSYSVEDLIDKLLQPTLLNRTLTKLPSKSIILEIGSVSIDLQGYECVNLVSNHEKNGIHSFLSGLGSLYNLDYNPKLDKLYPQIQWPVSAGTPMLSPLIKWNHTEDWFVAKFKAQDKMKSAERCLVFSIKDSELAFMAGHVIDRRNLIPASGYIIMVWDTISVMIGQVIANLKVVFENVRFRRATNIPPNGSISLFMVVQRGTGQFEVRESGQVIVSGRVYASKDSSSEIVDIPLPMEETSSMLYTTKDIYKELRLRGYNYTGLFRGIKNCDPSASKGLVEWTGNWTAFIDNMFQLQLLQEDSRNLYVPTTIERLVIDPQTHLEYAKTFGEAPILPVYAYKSINLIKSGGITIQGLFAHSISRRKQLTEPVLEKYKFIPFETKLTTEESVRVFAQLFSENNFVIKVRVVEVVDDLTKEGTLPLGPAIYQAFNQLPLIQPQVVVLSKNGLDMTNVTVEDKKLTSENQSCSLVIVSGIANSPEIKQQAMNALVENGFIISREDLNLDIGNVEKKLEGLAVLAVHETHHEKLVLLRRRIQVDKATLIDISKYHNLTWLTTLKAAINNNQNVILVAQNEPVSGILGLANCLRLEATGLKVQCVFIQDSKAPTFDAHNEFYSKQLKKGFAINVFKNGKWGTYRHLLLEKDVCVEREHVFNNVTVRGDLSSLRWIEGPLTSKTVLPPEKELVHVYYSSLNFRDIMTATGRISADHITRNRLEQYNVQGFEFSGRNSSGRRVMGMMTSGALASMVSADTHLTWEIPDNLSMAEAATIPVAYGTVLVAFVLVAEIKPGQSILIHAGSGAVGQAAITVALYHKCRIFTTVGTKEKRDFIRKTFPQIPESHIGNSRDTSFEQMILKETHGRGVDVVLNSLAEEKLQASLRCLAPYGKFLEIGKFDLVNNNPIGLKLLSQGRTFQCIMLDAFFGVSPSKKKIIGDLLTESMAKGMIKPLIKTVFKEDEVEQAFRYMAAGKHIGKVIIKLREEEPGVDVVPEMKLFNGISRFYGNPNRSSIICGGLGGFGLELADWLVTRGVRNLVLVSRSGVTTGYQNSRIRIWESYGVNVTISSENITTKEGCVSIINQANDLGPVEAIFNLAVVLKDGLVENQTEENFIVSLAPKAVATKYLDVISREMCPELRYFVVFSSVACGRGNVGQSNYAMANSTMERICEQRKSDGYPALAIQWGAVGDVGLVAEMQEAQTEIEIRGTLQQRISSCLEMMDTFLGQHETIVSSMVVAEKKSGVVGAGNMLDAVKNILGLQNLKTISLYASLSELGMDSMMAIEIKQTLEREYEVFLTAQDIRSLTFTRLLEIADEKATENATQKSKGKGNDNFSEGLNFLLGYMNIEENTVAPLIKMKTLIKEEDMAPKVFLIPGIDGLATVMETLAANLSSHAICLQYPYSDQGETTVEELAKTLFLRIKENLPKNTQFNLVAYSYGGAIALELASLLEGEDYRGKIVLIDGSAALFKESIKQNMPELVSDAHLQTVVLCGIMKLYIPLMTVMQHKNDIYNCKTFEERVQLALKLAPADTPQSQSNRKLIYWTAYLRIKSMQTYTPRFPKLRSLVKLFKPSQPTIRDFDEDYKIQELCETPVEITTFDGNHWTIMKNPQIGDAINKIVEDTSRDRP